MRSIRRHRAVARHCVVVTCRAAIFILSLLVVQAAHAQSEEQIMSAFLFNFARYVEWPKHVFDRPDSPVEICTLGADDFGGVVSRTVSGKIVGDRPVSVRILGNLEGSEACHILFIGRDFETLHLEAVAALDGLSVFTVADQEGFAVAGGIANFFRSKNRIRFEINPIAAEKAGLKISSRLLRLARVVE